MFNSNFECDYWFNSNFECDYWFLGCFLYIEATLLSLRATTTEARAPRARAPQQEKPPQ